MDGNWDREKACCFTGHRNIPLAQKNKVKNITRATIEKLIAKGTDVFVCGGALGFDVMAAKIVLGLKEKHPQIQLIMAIPCRDQHAMWCQRDKVEYEDILIKADEVYCLNDKYCTGCMHQRNRFMVMKSKRCIAYYTGINGGTSHTVAIAKEEGLEIINVAQMV
jgi:uncharacterized phage-like protein YoqJ